MFISLFIFELGNPSTFLILRCGSNKVQVNVGRRHSYILLFHFGLSTSFFSSLTCALKVKGKSNEHYEFTCTTQSGKKEKKREYFNLVIYFSWNANNLFMFWIFLTKAQNKLTPKQKLCVRARLFFFSVDRYKN